MSYVPSVVEKSDRGGGVDLLGRRTYSRSFEVTASNRLFNVTKVLDYFYTVTGIAIGSQWIIGTPFDAWYEIEDIYVTDLSVKCLSMEGGASDGQAWILTARYDSIDPTMLGLAAIPSDVLYAPIRIEWGEWTERRAVLRDIAGKVITNSAGDLFSEAIEEDRLYSQLTIERYERTFNDTVADTYRGTVNETEVTIRGHVFAPRTLKCISIVGTEDWHDAIGRFHKVRYQLARRGKVWADGQGWDEELANVGYRELVAGDLKHINDPATGQPVTEPVPLVVASGAAMSQPLASTDDMPTVTYRISLETEFADFNFPTV
jgi:hypothetical protein